MKRKNIKSEIVITSFKINKGLLEEIDYLVKKKCFSSRSEIIREVS